jgi:hypothetical protein
MVGEADDDPCATGRDDAAEPEGAPVPATTGLRRVVFRGIPGNVKIIVDGHPVVGHVRLAHGIHKVEASDPCCEPLTKTFEVVPAADDRAQLVNLQLEYKPAMIALIGAPEGSSIHCESMKIGHGSAATFPMSTITREISCTASDGRASTIELQAGATTTFHW